MLLAGLEPHVVGLVRLPLFHQLVELAAELGLEDHRLRGRDGWPRTNAFGMVGDDEKIERALKLCTEARARGDALALREPVGVYWPSVLPIMPASVE